MTPPPSFWRPSRRTLLITGAAALIWSSFIAGYYSAVADYTASLTQRAADLERRITKTAELAERIQEPCR